VGAAAVHLVGANVSTTQALQVGDPIELAFDRLLDPSILKRQTFVMSDLAGNFLQPTIAYDPVARVVRLCMQGPALQPDQTYRITIQAPTDPTDTNGLRAIDGATLDPTQNNVLEFPVVPSTRSYTGYDACDPTASKKVDFCAEVMPIFQGKCGTSKCHGASSQFPAAGLVLTYPALLRATALNRVAQGSNTGTRAAAGAPGAIVFGVDMPIIDTASAPGDSWLVYKILLAPPACSVMPLDSTCSAPATGVQNPRLAATWTPLADGERQTLSDWVLGREMPFPSDPSADPGTTNEPLTVDEMETVSLWVLQGAPAPDCQ
jgi:hypothetical protein